MREWRGISASPGIAEGPAFILAPGAAEAAGADTSAPEDPSAEHRKLSAAMAAAAAELESLARKMERRGRRDEAEIFGIQLEFLDDPSYGRAIDHLVLSGTHRALHAVREVSETLEREFAAIEDDYFRGRLNDIEDIARRLSRHLLGIDDHSPELKHPSVILADDLTPSDTALFDPAMVLGICTRGGSAVSHSAILSRGLGIPAVVGLGPMEIHAGTLLVVDASAGVLIADPSPGIREEYRCRAAEFSRRRNALMRRADKPARSIDGVHVEAGANIGDLREARQAVNLGADAVGLLRTEFLFLQRCVLPDEEEQYRCCREILEALGERRVVFRTLDVGGDKPLPSITAAPEANPFLGRRGVRLARAFPERLLYPQLRALLRAGYGRSLHIMFPMISGPDEFIALRNIVGELSDSLGRAGVPRNSAPSLGVMIEIPSAAIRADLLADEADFFSIGTNDLLQYTFAADRTNETVTGTADYFNPAFLSLITHIIDCAHEKGKPVGMCGEMAGDPQALPLLLALGLDELSMTSASIPEIKDAVRRLDIHKLKDAAPEIHAARSAPELRSLAKRLYETGGEA